MASWCKHKGKIKTKKKIHSIVAENSEDLLELLSFSFFFTSRKISGDSHGSFSYDRV